MEDLVKENPVETLRQAQIDADLVQVKMDELMMQYKDREKTIIEVTFLKGGWGFIQRRELKTHLKIYVKVFHGQRKVYEIDVAIMDKIQVIFDQLQKRDEKGMRQYFKSKLIYPMGRLRNLNLCLNDTFLDQQIPDGAKLVLVGKQSFTWDINAKGDNIQLLNHNLTANKKVEVEYETVLGTIEISSGMHYWEIKIDKFVELDDIIIGVS